MKPLARPLFTLCIALLAGTALAHEADEAPASPAPAGAVSGGERPQKLADNVLLVPKPVQRLLDLRTGGMAQAAPIEMAAEVQRQPDAPGAILAPQGGFLEPGPEGWPLSGRRLHTGSVLAYLHPLMTKREAARRKAEIAALAQKEVIARLNAERLAAQRAGTSGNDAGNIYYEQAKLEIAALDQRRAFLQQSLSQRVPITAPVSGLLVNTSVQDGDVVVTGQPLFDVVDPRRLRLSVPVLDPELAARTAAAEVTLPGGQSRPLVFRAREPQRNTPGWRLLYDLDGGQTGEDDDLPLPGQILRITLQPRVTAADLWRKACVTAPDGQASVWLHTAPERFERVVLDSCGGPLPAAQQATLAQARLVTQGAELLNLY